MHIETIEKTLEELDCSMINSVFVFNKIDMISSKKIKSLFKKYPKSIFISCKSSIGIDDLVDYIKKIITKNYIKETIKIPYNKLNHINDIYKTLDVLNRKDKEHYVLIDVEGSKEKLKWIKSKLREKT